MYYSVIDTQATSPHMIHISYVPKFHNYVWSNYLNTVGSMISMSDDPMKFRFPALYIKVQWPLTIWHQPHFAVVRSPFEVPFPVGFAGQGHQSSSCSGQGWVHSCLSSFTLTSLCWPWVSLFTCLASTYKRNYVHLKNIK